jgi:hypothetical protein
MVTSGKQAWYIIYNKKTKKFREAQGFSVIYKLHYYDEEIIGHYYKETEDDI